MVIALLIAVETICSVFSLLSYGAASPNAMFRANLQRTGVYQTQGLRRLHGVKWKFKTERIIEAWFSSPAISEETVYFGSDDSYLYAANALTGELRWKFKTGDVVYSSPAISDATVFVGSHEGYLYAVRGGRKKLLSVRVSQVAGIFDKKAWGCQTQPQEPRLILARKSYLIISITPTRWPLGLIIVPRVVPKSSVVMSKPKS
jgi:PQQ enzyme repeat